MTALTDVQLELALELRLEESDIGNVTLREYLHRLLRELWIQADEFSGKRPLGDSDWQGQVYKTLIVAELIDGEIDDDGYIDDCDDAAGEVVILQLIDYIFRS